MQTISRRDLLRSSAAIVVGFSLGNLGSLGKRALAQDAAAAKSVDPDQVDSFLAIHHDGSVTVYTSRVDVGTGMRIAIPQMAAEELGIPVERISVVEGDTDLTADTGGTGGSNGLTRGGVEVRQAAATLRAALVKLGPNANLGDLMGEEKKALAALEHARGFLRHELAARLNLRRIPELHFSVDSHPDADGRIDFLLRRAKRLRSRD
jgi:ABC-type glycerol-3-phosphate transport system substrate-binding protein